MEKVINHDNINDYMNGEFKDITKIMWQAGELNETIIKNFPNLLKLDCGDNQITTLEPLSNCINLQVLGFEDNQITTLEPISNCINLRELNCLSNQITTLEPLIYLRQLEYLDYDGNPLEPQTIQIQRLLNRVDTNHNSSIYSDNQNVHDVTIQRTVCDSIQCLLKDPKPDFSIDLIINSNLDAKTIESLIEYCLDDTFGNIYFHFLFRFAEAK